MIKNLTVRHLYETLKNDLALSVVTSPQTLDKAITDQEIFRPGLAFAGYYSHFHYHRVQLIGETEIGYLSSLSEEVLFQRLNEVLMYNIPCFFISKGLAVPPQMEFLASELNIAIIVSRLSTVKLFWQLSRYLKEWFALSLTMHATMVDVYGVGVLLTGKSGIGKSECALELVEKGHRLVSDDLTLVKSDEIKLTGTSPRKFGYFMEVRGVGVIDIEKMFGVQAIRKEKQIDIQVELMLWHENMDYERLGMGERTTEMLDIKIPIVNVPVSPGKNVAAIVEVVALNHILKKYGDYDAGQVLQKMLAKEIQEKHKSKKDTE
jgi:HPr kinase/phosphorylase